MWSDVPNRPQSTISEDTRKLADKAIAAGIVGHSKDSIGLVFADLRTDRQNRLPQSSTVSGQCSDLVPVDMSRSKTARCGPKDCLC
jgi:hypothetical protein